MSARNVTPTTAIKDWSVAATARMIACRLFFPFLSWVVKPKYNLKERSWTISIRVHKASFAQLDRNAIAKYQSVGKSKIQKVLSKSGTCTYMIVRTNICAYIHTWGVELSCRIFYGVKFQKSNDANDWHVTVMKSLSCKGCGGHDVRRGACFVLLPISGSFYIVESQHIALR